MVFLAAGLERVRPAGIATAIANLLFTVVAVVVVLDRPVDLTTAGVVALLGSGVYTLVLADLQYLGVRRIKGWRRTDGLALMEDRRLRSIP